MINFSFSLPTEIIFGKGVENDVGKEIKKRGGSRVLVHYGGDSAKRSGLLERVSFSLNAVGIEHIELGGVVPNPRLGLVKKGVELCKKHNIDYILAVGGGSVIDSSKAIALGVKIDFDLFDLFERKATPTEALPVCTILTIAAAGSESSDSAVITKEEGLLKRACVNECIRPVFSMLNPELTFTLPKYQTASGIVDIMMHTLDRYFTSTRNVDLIDRLSEGLLCSVIKNAPVVMEDPQNYDARAEIMWAGSLSHNNLMGTGRETDFAVHQIEHELSGMFDVTHGAGLAAVWGSWARYVYKADVARFAQYANRVWHCEVDMYHPENTALEGIERTEEFFRSLEMPISITELGIKNLNEHQIEELAEKCSFFSTRKIGNFMKLDKKDIAEIYRMAK